MHLRMQGLDAAVEHFREAGVIGHVGNGAGRRRAGTLGAAGGQQLDAEGDSSRANSTTPVLSETQTGLGRGDFHGASPVEGRGSRGAEMTGNGLFGLTGVRARTASAQGVAVDAEHLCAQGLVAAGLLEDEFKHRAFDVLITIA